MRIIFYFVCAEEDGRLFFFFFVFSFVFFFFFFIVIIFIFIIFFLHLFFLPTSMIKQTHLLLFIYLVFPAARLPLTQAFN